MACAGNMGEWVMTDFACGICGNRFDGDPMWHRGSDGVLHSVCRACLRAKTWGRANWETDKSRWTCIQYGPNQILWYHQDGIVECNGQSCYARRVENRNAKWRWDVIACGSAYGAAMVVAGPEGSWDGQRTIRRA